MKTRTGTYYNGQLVLDGIGFLDGSAARSFNDFCFSEIQELLKDCKSFFSEEVVEERVRGLM